MKETHTNARALRIERICKEGASLHGSWPLAALQRLSEGLAGPADGSVTWRLQGSTRTVAGGAAQLWVQLGAQAVVPMQCQRCLAPMLQRLEVDQAIRFVHGEEKAAQLDEETEDDVLCLPAALDLQALVEDELILALPIVPRHEGPCPQPLLPDSTPLTPVPEEHLEAHEPHPFAALAALKGKGRLV
jgi:uncharacterized protein